jgi:hypothetical protein
MQLPVTRRLRRIRPSPISPWALLGFSAGVAAGFLLREMLGKGTRNRAGRLIRSIGRPGGDPRSVRTTTILAVLDAEPELTGVPFSLLPVGRDGFELRGWVATRSARTRAYRLAQAASGEFAVVNRLLVRGEDDATLPRIVDDEPRSA